MNVSFNQSNFSNITNDTNNSKIFDERLIEVIHIIILLWQIMTVIIFLITLCILKIETKLKDHIFQLLKKPEDNFPNSITCYCYCLKIYIDFEKLLEKKINSLYLEFAEISIICNKKKKKECGFLKFMSIIFFYRCLLFSTYILTLFESIGFYGKLCDSPQSFHLNWIPTKFILHTSKLIINDDKKTCLLDSLIQYIEILSFFAFYILIIFQMILNLIGNNFDPYKKTKDLKDDSSDSWIIFNTCMIVFQLFKIFYIDKKILKDNTDELKNLKKEKDSLNNTKKEKEIEIEIINLKLIKEINNLKEKKKIFR